MAYARYLRKLQRFTHRVLRRLDSPCNGFPDLIRDAQAMEMEMQGLSQDAAAKASALKRESRQKWLEDICSGGAGKAHAVTQMPEDWRPTTVQLQTSQGPVETADVVEVLAVEAAKWSQLWEAEEFEEPDNDAWWAGLLQTQLMDTMPLTE